MKSTSGGIQVREVRFIALPALAVLAGAFWLAFQFVEPGPPKTIVITTGLESGAYYTFAQRYAKLLERSGIKLEVRPSKGSVDNVERLRDPNSGVQLGLLQGGIADAKSAPELVSLGRVFLEPLWIFYRADHKLQRISELGGKRIAIGPEGSGTRKFAETLLKQNGMIGGETKLLALGGQAAADALLKGETDAIMLVLASDNAIVQSLLRDPDVRLMNLAQAEAYSRLLPYLSRVVLPQGVVDLGGNIPSEDVSLLAAQTALVAREDLHPAILALMAQTASEVHAGAGLFQRPGEFPKVSDPEFPMSEDAVRSYKSGQPFLQRYLPFWVAVLVQRLAVMLLPIATIALPLVKLLPQVYQWRIRRRILNWYAQLKRLENRLNTDRMMTNADQHRADIEHIEEAVSTIPVPLRYSTELYDLKSAVALVRQRIMARA